MNLQQAAQDLVGILQKHQHQAFYVGGCVRDQLLGLAISDIDIATSATSDVIQGLFPKTIPVGIKFGIVIVVHHGFHFEVATFRQDLSYHNGRHPDQIVSATIQEDVQRRDFTINGLYYDPYQNQVIDLVQGKQDLSRRLIKAIGNPLERFTEDHLRMIRAARYAATLNFSIEEATKEAIISMASQVKQGLSMERIHQELDKMHQKGALSSGLKWLYELKLLPYLFPKLPLDDTLIKTRCDQIRLLHKQVPLIFALMILCHIRDEPTLGELVSYLKMSNQALKQGLESLKLYNRPLLSNLELAELLALDYSHELILMHAAINSEPLIAQMEQLEKNLQPVIERLKTRTPIISAQDLLDLGVPKGPQIKLLMRRAMELLADDPHTSKDTILTQLKLLL